jgi:hypothetical protein
MLKEKNVSALDEENNKMSKRLSKAKGVYNFKKMVINGIIILLISPYYKN